MQDDLSEFRLSEKAKAKLKNQKAFKKRIGCGQRQRKRSWNFPMRQCVNFIKLLISYLNTNIIPMLPMPFHS